MPRRERVTRFEISPLQPIALDQRQRPIVDGRPRRRFARRLPAGEAPESVRGYPGSNMRPRTRKADNLAP